MRLENKHILITGGARGLGAGIAETVCAEGATVTLADVLAERGEAMAKHLRDQGHDAVYAQLDVRSENEWSLAVDQVLARVGRLDGLVNNAGILNTESIEDLDLDELRRIYDVNVFGGFLGMKAVFPVMKAQGKGAIVNIGSNATQRFLGPSLAYGSSKAAFTSISKSVALSGAALGIRVNIIHPGPIATDMIMGDGGDTQPLLNKMIASIPMGRLARPSDVGSVAAFLLSDDAAYMTAAEVLVDGGVTPFAG